MHRALGRLAVQIAHSLRGKHKPTFAPHVDTGNFVVVVNADKVRLSGKKEDKKLYRFNSGYRGGLKTFTAGELRVRHPDWLIKLAVKRMLPRNTQSRTIFKRLKVYAGVEHPHGAQGPKPMPVR